MSLQAEEQNLIKTYLLGELNPEERQRVEQRLLTDHLFLDELLGAEDELIDQYLEDLLTEREKQRFEDHFLSTTERRRKLRFAQTLSKYVARSTAATQETQTTQTTQTTPSTPAPKPRFLTWPRWLSTSSARVAVALFAIIAVGLIVWVKFFSQSEIDKGLLALQAAYSLQRPTEARISGFGYAPLITTRGNAQGNVDSKSRDRAAAILSNAEHEHPGPAASHALGKLYLAERKFDQAISQFEVALKSDPNNAQLENDLGAAWLERGKAGWSQDDPGKSFEDFARGLEYTNKALALNGSLPEALFNRALIYQRLLLPQQAEEAWRKYLEQDPHSQWAEEANRNLKLLEEQKNKVSLKPEQMLQIFLSAYKSRDDDGAWKLISQNRSLSGNPVENSLLDAYLESRAAGREESAKEKFEVVSYAGELEAQRAGDYFIQHLAHFYKSLPLSRLAPLTEARRLMQLGHENILQSKAEDALADYSKARQIFEETGDGDEALYLEYPMAHCYLLLSKPEISLKGFEKVARAAEENRYRWLLAQSLNGIATTQITLNNYSLALDSSERALHASEQIDDVGGVIKTEAQIAQEYLSLGNYHKSLSFNQQSLALALGASQEPMQLWRSYFTIAMPLNFLGMPAAAVEFQKEALRLALGMNRPQLVCRTYVNLGLMYGSQRNYDEAIKNIQQALELGRSLPSPKVRMDTLAYSSLQLGHVYRQAGAFNQAAENYDLAIQLYGQLDYPAFNYVAHKGKLLSCLAGGACPSIEQEIETSLNLFEQYRSRILEESNRDSFFDTEQNVCDVAVGYAFSTGDARKAFDYAERCRARSLLDLTSAEVRVSESKLDQDLLSNSIKQSVNLTELQAQMSERVQILQYAVLDDKLIIWFISKTNFSSHEQPLDSQELRDKVLAYVQSISGHSATDEEQMRRESAQLYDLLIKPVAALLDRDKQLSIIPDKILNHLPYAALISSTSGKYLAEEFALTFAPSSSLFIFSSDAARQRVSSRPERLLSVGNPSFDRKAFPTLDDLPQAVTEAKKITTYYSSPRTFVNEQATRKRVESEMAGADVIHLALHSVTDERSPLHSKLLFAVDTAKDLQPEEAGGVMQVYEIYRMKLPLTRLVVLSACQTGVERYYNGEGMIGISRPFISRGVPLVVASLWAVDSDATAELMISFHKHRKTENLSTAEALRRAQQDMIHQNASRSHPYYWAAFITIGGYTEF